MSLNNDKFFNLSLILIASVVDALWYLLLVNLVTSKSVFELLRNKSYLIKNCWLFIYNIINNFINDLLK